MAVEGLMLCFLLILQRGKTPTLLQFTFDLAWISFPEGPAVLRIRANLVCEKDTMMASSKTHRKGLLLLQP